MATAAARIAPVYVKTQDKSLFRSYANNLIKGAVKRVRECNIPISGAYLGVTPDIADFYDIRLLKVIQEDGKTKVEVLAPHAERLGIKEFIAIKYPKMHTREFLLCKVVPVEEYVERVNKSAGLTDENKKWIKILVRHLTEGVFMLPAKEDLKNLAAGLDFDSDAAQCFYDKFVVDTIGKLPMLVVNINRPKVDADKKDVVDSTLGFKALLNYVSNENLSVGQVTVMNEIFIELERLLKHGTKDDKALALKAFGRIFDPKGEYGQFLSAVMKKRKGFVPVSGRKKGMSFCDFEKVCNANFNPTSITDDGLDKIEVSVKFGEDVTYACQHMELTVENALAALPVLQSLERMYQELTLDAAKEATKVAIYYRTNPFARLKSRKTKVDFKIRWSDDEPVLSCYDKDFQWEIDDSGTCERQEANDKNPVLYIQDALQEIRIAGMKQITATAEELKAIADDSRQGFDDEIKNKVAEFLSDESKYELFQTVYAQKMIFSDLTILKNMEIAAIEAQAEENHAREDEKAKQFINNKYAELFAALGNNIRCLFFDAGITNNDDKMYCLLASLVRDRSVMCKMNKLEDKDLEFTSTSFISKVFPEEYLLFILEHAGACYFTRDELLYANCKDGDVLHFSNGIGTGEDGQDAMCAVALEGDFVVKFEGKKAYATKYIGDIIQSKIPQPDFSQRIFITTDYKNVDAFNTNKNAFNDAVAVMFYPTDMNCSSYVNTLAKDGKKGLKISKAGNFKVPGTELGKKLYKDIKGEVVLSVSGYIEGRNASVAIAMVKNAQEATYAEKQEAVKLVTELEATRVSKTAKRYAPAAKPTAKSSNDFMNQLNAIKKADANKKEEVIADGVSETPVVLDKEPVKRNTKARSFLNSYRIDDEAQQMAAEMGFDL